MSIFQSLKSYSCLSAGVNTLAILKLLDMKIGKAHLQGYSLSGGTPGDPAANGGAGAVGTGQAQAKDGAIFLGNNFRLGEADIENQSPKTTNWNMSKGTDTGSFDTTLRLYPEFRFNGGIMTGIVIAIPALTRVVINFDILSYNKTKFMDLAS
jgi:hypothetical protein